MSKYREKQMSAVVLKTMAFCLSFDEAQGPDFPSFPGVSRAVLRNKAAQCPRLLGVGRDTVGSNWTVSAISSTTS